MLTARVFWENGNVSLVMLTPDIKILVGQSTDNNVVCEALQKAKARDPNVVGVVVSPRGNVMFYRDGKYRVVIWPRQILSGKWKECTE